MSMPQTGGPGLFYVVLGMALVVWKGVRWIVKRIRAYFFSILILALLSPQPATAAFSMPGSHWNSGSNEDGIVLRGTTEQGFSLPLFGEKSGFNLSLLITKRGAFGLDPTKNWNRRLEGSIGPVIAYKVGGGVIRLGAEASYGLRPDTSCFNLTPVFDFWFGWRYKDLTGSSWGSIKQEPFGEGLVGRFFIEQGAEFAKWFGALSLNANTIFQGVYGTEPYPWNRKFEVMAGPEVKLGPGKLGCYYLFSSRPDQRIHGFQAQMSWWIGWNLRKEGRRTTRRPNESPSSINQKIQTIWLTIDGGIGGEMIETWLDTLDCYEVKATFFVVGEELVRLPDMLNLIERRGHGIGNHTWSHPDLTTLDEQGIITEVHKVDSVVGRKLHLMRPPYFAIDGRVLSILQAKGYEICLATIDPRDWEASCTAESVVARIGEGLKREHEVIILHLAGAGGQPSLQALSKVIRLCRERGYTFVLRE